MKRCLTLCVGLFLAGLASGCCCGGSPFGGSYGGCGPGGCPSPVVQGAFAPMIQSTAAAPLGAQCCTN